MSNSESTGTEPTGPSTPAADPRAEIRGALEQFREQSLRGKLTLLFAAFVTVLAVVLTVFAIDYANTLRFTGPEYMIIFFGFGFSLYYLLTVKRYIEGEDDIDYESGLNKWLLTGILLVTPSSVDEQRAKNVLRGVDAVVALAGAALTLFAAWYLWTNFTRLQSTAQILGLRQMDTRVGLVIVALTIDTTRRAYGWAISAVAIGTLLYAYFGQSMPGILQHPGMDLTAIARFSGMNATNGLFSFIFRIGTTWVAIFIMFAGMAKAFGALDYILALGREAEKKLRTGIVQIAVIASMIMGSITGSAAANTATTGSFTIPMMNQQGVREDFSAAIESVASSGGQIMPPVMGVAAFLMADFLNISFVEVLKAGTIPALLFYFSVLVATHLVVLRFGWTSAETGKIDTQVAKQGVHFLVPMGVLLYTLIWLELSPHAAGLYTILALIGTVFAWELLAGWLDVGALLRGADTETTAAEDKKAGEPRTGYGLLTRLWGVTKQTVDGLRQGAVDMAPLTAILAIMGIIFDVLNRTALPSKLSSQMISISGDLGAAIGLGGNVLFFLLLVAMVTSILFGLGMPTPAAYILVAALVAPSLIQFGVQDLVAHMFIFYFAILSAITPPVAVAVAIGARISGASFMGASKQALRIGAVGFLVPFAFVTNPELILWSAQTPLTLLAMLVAVVAVTIASIGYDGKDVLDPARRVMYLGLALLTMFAPIVGGATDPMVATTLQLGGAGTTLALIVLTQLQRLPKVIEPAGER
jgi:TRAP transporter 4TM/12TM fusion protein